MAKFTRTNRSKVCKYGSSEARTRATSALSAAVASVSANAEKVSSLGGAPAAGPNSDESRPVDIFGGSIDAIIKMVSLLYNYSSD